MCQYRQHRPFRAVRVRREGSLVFPFGDNSAGRKAVIKVISVLYPLISPPSPLKAIPVLAIILTQGAVLFFREQGPPDGLLNNVLLLFGIWGVYGVLVTVLYAIFEERACYPTPVKK